jgi:iron complex outermembrane recepter protein
MAASLLPLVGAMRATVSMALRQITVTIGLLGVTSGGFAQSVNLDDISLEELLNVEVTSVSKKEEALFRASSAIAVLTSEDLRRSGASSIPDALRLVPGLQVAAVDGNRWAVSARGFNSLYANKLLVLIDGRSIYNATYSGVFWDMQDVPLENIDRIEVIRGPGAALWGANAVNGVINIITKAARLTQGAYVATSAGSLDRGSITARYGGTIGPHSYYRVTTKYLNRGQTVSNGGVPPNDAWQMGLAQFRLDTKLSATDAIVTSVGFATGDMGQSRQMVTGVMPWDQAPLTEPVHAKDINARFRWNRTISSASDLSVQASFEDTDRSETLIGTTVTVGSIEFQHHVRTGRHDIVWGAGQRVTSDRERTTFGFGMTPNRARVALTNLFAQDQIALIPDRLQVTVGSKFEYVSIGDAVHVQPNVRLSYTPTRGQTIWGAVSEAVRTPSRNELAMTYRYAAIPGEGLPMVLAIVGNPDLRPERVRAFEVGYRIQPTSRVQIDSTAFVNDYYDLQTLANTVFVETDPGPAHLVAGLRYTNGARAHMRGAEVLGRVQALRSWMLEGAVSGLSASFDARRSPEFVAPPRNVYSPTMQWRLTSRLSLPFQLEADTTLFRVGSIDALLGSLPAYSRLDARIGWSSRHWNISLIGQNLASDSHVEFDGIDGLVGSRIPRSATARVTWAF